MIRTRFTVTSAIDDSPIAGASIATNFFDEAFLTDSNGEVEFSMNQKIPYTLTYTASKLGYDVYSGTADLDEAGSVNLVPVSLSPSTSSIRFIVTSAVEDSPIVGVSIATNLSNEDFFLTDSNGEAEFSTNQIIPYTLAFTASKLGYDVYSGTADLDEAGSVNLVPVSLSPSTSSIRFIVTSAVEDSPIVGVSIATNLSNEDFFLTDSNGEAEFSTNQIIPYTLTYTASKLGYDVYSGTADLDNEGTVNLINIFMSPVLEDQNYRVVMSWGPTPRDLDLTVIEYDDNTACTTNHGNKNGCSDTSLDRDNTDGGDNGPETITWGDQTSKKYLIYVDHYSGNINWINSQVI